MLSENYLKKQKDIEVNMLEQEIDVKLLDKQEELGLGGERDPS